MIRPMKSKLATVLRRAADRLAPVPVVPQPTTYYLRYDAGYDAGNVKVRPPTGYTTATPFVAGGLISNPNFDGAEGWAFP